MVSGVAVEVEDGLTAGDDGGVSGRLNVWFKADVVASVGISRRIAGVTSNGVLVEKAVLVLV